ncbi:hypothetical protein BH10ACT1_BH10ACT1_18720 [soil metagenome]
MAALALGSVAACSKDSGSEAEFCREVKEIPTLDSVVAGFADTEPSALDARLDDASAAYAALRRSAPDDIADSVDEVTDLVDAVIDAVRSHPDDPEAAAAQLRTAVEDHPGGAAASEQVVAYASEHCQVELDPSVEESTTTTVAPATSSPAETTAPG